MASTATLILAIAVGAALLLAVRELLWRAVSAADRHAVVLIPRLAETGVWTGSGPWRTRLAGRFPRSASFASARVSLQSFSGLPSTLMVLASLAALAALVALIAEVRRTAGAIQLDQSVNAFFGPYRAAWLVKAFAWVTGFAVGPSLTVILLTATALLWSCERGGFIVPLWITFLGAQATTWSSKYLIDRPRPVFLPTITEWNPSFPSGHATAATALIGFLGYAVSRNLTGARARYEAAFWAAALIALICFSRIFLSLHFLTDVTAGVLVGLFWLLIGIMVAEHGRDQARRSVVEDRR